MPSTLVRLCVFAVLIGLFGCGKSPQTYVDAGNRFFQEGKYPDAELNYKKALQRDAKFADAHYRLGLVFLKQSKPREAINSLSQAVELAPANDDALDKLSNLLLAAFFQDRTHPVVLYTRLTKLSEEALRHDPRSFQGLSIQGFLKMADRKPEESKQAFERALAIRPEDPDVSLGIFRPLVDLNQAAEAERIARAAIEKHKGFGPLYDALYVLLISQDRMPDAEKILDVKRLNNPTNTDFALEICGHYFEYKKEPELAAAVRRILDDPKNYPDGPLKVGEFYARRLNWKEAAAQVELGMRNQPDQKASYDKLLIAILLGQNKVDEAHQITETLLKRDPKDKIARSVRGTISMRAGSLDAAMKDFQILVEEEPRNPVYHFKLGRTNHLKGDLTRAKSEYSESVKLRANYLPPRMGLAEISFDQRDYATAINYFRAMLKDYPGNPEVRVMLSAAMIGLGDHQKARAELTEVLREFPTYVLAEVQLAFVDLNQKQYKSAETLLRKHYQPGSSTLRILQGLVDVNLAQNQNSAAMDLLRNEIRRASNPAPVQQLLAATAIRTKQYSVAIAELEQLVAKQPGSAEIESKLGEAYWISEDTSNAIAHLQKAVELAPNQSGPVLMLGDVLALAGRAQEAKTRYQQALAVSPDDPRILNNLASLIADTGENLDEGMKNAQRALAKDPDNPNIRDTVGWLYAKMKNSDAAAQILENLTRKYPTNPSYQYHFGYLMLQKGQREHARKHLTLALSNSPAKEDEVAIRRLLATLGSS